MSRAARALRDELPAETAPLDDHTLRSLLHEAIEAARPHRVVIEWDVYRWARLRLRHGPDFEQLATVEVLYHSLEASFQNSDIAK